MAGDPQPLSSLTSPDSEGRGRGGGRDGEMGEAASQQATGWNYRGKTEEEKPGGGKKT